MQRQLRLGDILDDYCPRERRLTNHAVVAMVGDDVKQTRCTTCDAEHEYKHARVPRQRRKPEPFGGAASAAGAPKRIVPDALPPEVDEAFEPEAPAAIEEPASGSEVAAPMAVHENGNGEGSEHEEGPVHRPLIRAQLPRQEGQPPASRPAPDFTIRQPGGRQNRFRPRHQRSAQGFGGNRSNGNVGGYQQRGGGQRSPGGRPQAASRPNNRQGHGRKRSK